MSASKIAPYPNYKTGNEWFAKIPDEWEIVKIRRITSEHKQGYYTEQDYINDGIKLVRITDITDEADVDYSKMPFVSITKKEFSDFMVKQGDFLFARSGTIGRFGLVDAPEDSVFASYLIRFRFKNIDTDFMKIYLLSSVFKEQLISNLHGGANKNIHAENIKDVLMARPSYSEQRAIFDFVNPKIKQINETIKGLESEIVLLEEKRSALITQVVTKGLNPDVPMKNSGIEWIGGIPTHWEIIPLKRDFSVQLGKMLQNEQKLASDTQEYYLKSANVQWNGVSLEPEVKMWFSEVEKSKYLLKKDDLLISEGGDVGRSCLYNDEYKECYIQNAINRVRATSSVPTAYLYFFMKAMHESGFIAIICNKSTIPHFTAEKVAEVRFTRPPEDEIYSIVEYLTKECNAIDETSSLLLNKIEKLKEYRTALISAAVTGKIDVRSF